MPRTKKSSDLFLDEFPALTRLLEEITLHREKERIQPRLPFELPQAGDHNKPQRGSDEKRRKRF